MIERETVLLFYTKKLCHLFPRFIIDVLLNPHRFVVHTLGITAPHYLRSLFSVFNSGAFSSGWRSWTKLEVCRCPACCWFAQYNSKTHLAVNGNAVTRFEFSYESLSFFGNSISLFGSYLTVDQETKAFVVFHLGLVACLIAESKLV